jgi:tRNA A-37 threonylcarbamoyl transferase component Bud32
MKGMQAIVGQGDRESGFQTPEMLAPLQLQPAEDPPDAIGGFLPGLLVGKQIGVGRRCLVFAARCNGTDVVVKRYRSDAVDKHAQLADMPLAEFEFRRNQACYSVPGLDRNVARPFGYYVGGGAQWLVQERIEGALCSDSCAGWSDEEWGALRRRLLELVALAHSAGLYDLDLHPGNVMLSRSGGPAEPILFDFNLVPFTERRRPTLDGWLYRFGLVKATYRDLRRVRKRFR